MSSRVACSRGDRLSALIGRAPLTLDAQRPHPGGRVHAKNPSRRYACDVCRVCPQRPRTVPRTVPPAALEKRRTIWNFDI